MADAQKKTETRPPKSKDALYIESANPHAWWLSAHDLHQQVRESFLRRGKSIVTTVDGDGKIIARLDATDRTCFLLGGFALENMIKSIVVFENPDVISNCRLDKKLQTHNLTNLAEMTTNFTPSIAEIELFKIFSAAAVSWARYPCALNFQQSNDVIQFNASLNEAYEFLFASLDSIAKELLKSGWTSPIGDYNECTFEGQMS